MMMILFSHRHSKKDVFLVDTKREITRDLADKLSNGQLYFDFKIVRDCMYKYSKKAQETYFSYLFEAYFFAHFSQSSEAQQFLLEKDDMIGGKIEKVMAEIKVLKNESINSVLNHAQRQSESKKNINFMA